ncbi:hypothetical protein [Roseivirga ehrenbergii]|nr:hypothetical protein [Roseivirga ehrenbergii]
MIEGLNRIRQENQTGISSFTLEGILLGVFQFSVFFPFVSPVPIQSDVQPLGGLLAGVILALRFLSKKLVVEKRNLFLLLYTFLLLCFINPFGGFEIDYGKYLSMLYGMVLLLVFTSEFEIKANFFFLSILIYAGFTVGLLAMPNLFFNIQDMLIRNTNSVDFLGYRGISTLSTEPGLFGGLLVAFAMINDHLKSHNKLSNVKFFLLHILILFMILLTKSGTGYLYYVVFLGFKLFDNKIPFIQRVSGFSLVVILTVLLVIYLGSLGLNLGRGIDIIMKLSEGSSGGLGNDSSILYRLSGFYVSFLVMSVYPFGVGFGDVETTAQEFVYESEFLFSLLGNEQVHFTSAFSYTVMGAGLLAVGLFFSIFLLTKAKTKHKAFAFIFMFFSYSLAFPMIWLLLSLKKKK